MFGQVAATTPWAYSRTGWGGRPNPTSPSFTTTNPKIGDSWITWVRS